MNDLLMRTGICLVLCGASLMVINALGIGDLYMTFVYFGAIICRFKRYPRRFYEKEVIR